MTIKISVLNSLLPGIIAGVISVTMWQLEGWKALENLAYNTLFQIRDGGILLSPEWDERVAVIAIDETSLQEYGRFPWRRDRYAQLLQALSVSPPAVIGFDILFAEESPEDSQFADAMFAKGNVVLARVWDDKGKPLPIVPNLVEAAAAQGHILHKPDTDGISRQATLFVREIPSLGAAMLQVYNNSNQIPVSDRSVEFQPVLLNWVGKTQSLPTYSFVDVVAGRFPKNAFAGKFVLVGITATASDPLLTPLNQNPPTAGVYIHAAVIDNLLNNRLLSTVPKWGTVLLLLLVGPVSSRLFSTQGSKGRIAITFLLLIVWYAIALLLFTFANVWISIAAPIGTMVLSGVILQLREQQEKQQLMSLFEKYMAPETASLIWQRKTEIFHKGELKAQEMVATVLFMDIRGFTTISEKLTPRELLIWLNEYLDAMSDCIMNNGGVIDKYIGDAIMAVFGIPFPHTKPEEIQQDALNAIAASLAMHERLQQLNEHLLAQNKPKIEFGIGIHTGLIIAGSVGGSRRLNYSVLGDTVNIAARLEAMNKDVKEGNPYRLLVTGETYGYVRDRYYARPVKNLQLRGRERETLICAILGKK
ncbi:adenylate/guanylate cyclase domain-containing protein [Funiculus sociatus GB2-A5]|uniref:Adenylate/guanylate cyclase domain-containing protein n=1 Tax=Funiculus sociatus GB2-A5 TaxID=2933946 RepID=A0ABV0JSJ5_9CYAN|nr:MULTISPECIES: adenylate/guanylate cyclase domain-containing protein [unclassified Trichocoleus]MBD1907436.1 adenylate/guanylate cyclase domain-containing protein [Trichocoleus sp. FACHB-832]MBD2061124.1 adenylate/guanylate cyclase domain-containing protein [Trichocoleus sp. FACHB-6]